jgi:hypothetical protein
MICADCGIPMNHHAEKPLRSLRTDEYPELDAIFGGAVVSIHSCPGCGKTEIDTTSRE